MKAGSHSVDASCGASNFKVKLVGANPKFLCSVGVINTTGMGPYSSLVINAGNRVWLHQNANGTGWAACFSDLGWPDFSETIGLSGRDVNPGNIQMAANMTFC